MTDFCTFPFAVHSPRNHATVCSEGGNGVSAALLEKMDLWPRKPTVSGPAQDCTSPIRISHLHHHHNNLSLRDKLPRSTRVGILPLLPPFIGLGQGSRTDLRAGCGVLREKQLSPARVRPARSTRHGSHLGGRCSTNSDCGGSSVHMSSVHKPLLSACVEML